MAWLALIAAIVVVCLIGVVMHVDRSLEEIRRYRRDWYDLAVTQEKHEIDIRWVLQLVNPMARRGKAPMPRHLQEISKR